LRLIRDDDSRELRGNLLPRVRRVLTAVIAAQDMKAVRGPPGCAFTRSPATVPERGAFQSAAIGV
jgi:hypothetical protein